MAENFEAKIEWVVRNGHMGGEVTSPDGHRMRHSSGSRAQIVEMLRVDLAARAARLAKEAK